MEPPNPEDLTDAEKWQAWTKGEYRLICHTKYQQFAADHKTLKKIRSILNPKT